jgi:hypothetical protein
MSDPLHRKRNLAALLAAQGERSFPLTAHQFMRLGGEWWSERFKKKVGYRATLIHKDIFEGKLPRKVRMKGDGRFLVNLYPRGVIEQAFAQVLDELFEAGGEAAIEAERAEPYEKREPGALEEVEELEALWNQQAVLSEEIRKRDTGRPNHWQQREMARLTLEVERKIAKPSWVKEALRDTARGEEGPNRGDD